MKPILKKYVTSILLFWTGSVIFMAIFFFAFISSQNKELNRLDILNTRGASDLGKLKDAADEKNKLKMNEEIDVLKAYLDGYAIDQQKSSNLTFDISSMSEGQNLPVVKIVNKINIPIENCNLISENNIYLNFTGTFVQFYCLLNELERHSPVLFVDVYELEQNEDEPGKCDVAMSLSVFVVKQKEEVAKGN